MSAYEGDGIKLNAYADKGLDLLTTASKGLGNVAVSSIWRCEYQARASIRHKCPKFFVFEYVGRAVVLRKPANKPAPVYRQISEDNKE